MTHLADYILPSDTDLNPERPEENFYMKGDRNCVGFVMQKVGADAPSHIFIGYHSGPGFGYDDRKDSWTLGNVFECLHDQTEEEIGNFEVVGRINFETGERDGLVPDSPLAHAVFK